MGTAVTHQHLIAVGLRLGHARGAGHAACAADVLDNDLLPERLAHARRQDAGDRVERASGRIWNDHRNGPCRPTLRDCCVRRNDDAAA